MKNSHIRWIVILGVIAIIAVIIVQIYWLRITYRNEESQFNNSVQVGLWEVSRRVAEMNQADMPAVNPVTRVSSNYFAVSIVGEIDKNVLEHFIKTELAKVKVITDFEFGIYDCFTNQMVYAKYVTASGKEEVDKSSYLPMVSGKDYYFGVMFPQRNVFLVQSMRIWIIFSCVLFATLIFFGYTIVIVLHQKRLSEIQYDFINNMTHEFKTPIASIRLASDFLINEEVERDERTKRYLSVIKEQNNRLNGIVNKVLNISKAETSDFRLNKDKVNLVDLLEQVTKVYGMRLQGKGSLEFVNTAGEVNLIADQFHLENILHNLLDNAMKYNDKPQTEIRVLLSREGRQVRLKVSDNGQGIDRKYHHKIFKKFFRIPTKEVTVVTGFGLGLYYVKKICDAHGWKIDVDSTPGNGTTFVLLIPTI